MSFFDESDEPRTEIRSPSRTPRRRGGGAGGSGGSGGSGSRRRGPGGAPPNQSILARRAIAVVAVVIVVILIAVGVNSCEGSARKSALRDYANSVNAVITRSDDTSSSLFKALGGGAGSSTQISQSINQTETSASNVLSQAKRLSVPSAAHSANSHLLLALQMRLDGITGIAGQIQAALGNSVRQSAVSGIANQMARFYASDVLYKDYVAPEIVGALHGSGIAVGGDNGAPVNSGQFLPDVQWLTPGYVASQLGVAVSSGSSGSAGAGRNGTGGLRGHALSSVSVNGAALSTATTNTIAASPTPAFTLNFSNGGNYNEFDVTCQVKVTSTSDAGTKVVAETYKGKPATCDVTLSGPPPKGTYTVTATVEKVPGEQNVANNTLSFPVNFN